MFLLLFHHRFSTTEQTWAVASGVCRPVPIRLGLEILISAMGQYVSNCREVAGKLNRCWWTAKWFDVSGQSNFNWTLDSLPQAVDDVRTLLAPAANASRCNVRLDLH